MFKSKSTAISVSAEPKMVMFCQIRTYSAYMVDVLEPSHTMFILTALKRLNFRIVTSTAADPHTVTYLCEHMGEGVDYEIVQNVFKEVCQDTLTPASSRSFKSTDGRYYVKWICG